MNSYHIWTIGCQMNKADSERLASALEQMGLQEAQAPWDADVVVLNSCVVRQSGRRQGGEHPGVTETPEGAYPDRVLALMGCMVGPRTEDLTTRFPMWTHSCAPSSTDRFWTCWGDAWGWIGKAASAT